jgi:cullin-associated NEDD8-dissociated protein 1
LDNNTSASLLEFLNDYNTFIQHVQLGLRDENQDIKMLAHLMISKLSKVSNATVPLLTTLDALSDALTTTVTTKLKPNFVSQEKDRHDDLMKSCLRAIHALSNIKSALDHTKFADLYSKTVKGDRDLRDLLERIQKESEKVDE